MAFWEIYPDLKRWDHSKLSGTHTHIHVYMHINIYNMFLFCSVFKSFEVFYCLMFCVLAFDLLSYEPTNTYICKPNKCITYIHTYIHTHTHGPHTDAWSWWLSLAQPSLLPSTASPGTLRTHSSEQPTCQHSLFNSYLYCHCYTALRLLLS